ncbi:MAG: PHB depolymerase family esterase, partial [Bradymonadaceae bacterium]
AGAPLVVALHGCGQTAADYDDESGWTQYADRDGFAVVLPQTGPANNPNRCFNWFAPEDSTRGSGEARSIRSMVEHLLAARELAPAHVYVTGLSAGGFMTSAMLAGYPEVFAGGAIIAGGPYRCASGATEGFNCMNGGV